MHTMTKGTRFYFTIPGFGDFCELVVRQVRGPKCLCCDRRLPADQPSYTELCCACEGQLEAAQQMLSDDLPDGRPASEMAMGPFYTTIPADFEMTPGHGSTCACEECIPF